MADFANPLGEKLEDVTVERCWQAYLQHNPPPSDIDPQEYEFVRQVYCAGFGAMLMLAQRLERESAERRGSILQKVEADLWARARAMNPESKPT